MPQPASLQFARSTPLQPRKNAILVGASSGIGAALARKLAQEGYYLALLARRGEMLASLCQEINQISGEERARAYIHDVSDYSNVPVSLQTILSDMGGLDLFIYNAGISQQVGLKKFDFEKDRLTIEVNLLGALAWLNPVAAIFQGIKAGQIVGISSVAGERGRVGNPSYNASKAAGSSAQPVDPLWGQRSYCETRFRPNRSAHWSQRDLLGDNRRASGSRHMPGYPKTKTGSLYSSPLALGNVGS
jgi:nucleoside-diphosphate-sugar epimerase